MRFIESVETNKIRIIQYLAPSPQSPPPPLPVFNCFFCTVQYTYDIRYTEYLTYLMKKSIVFARVLILHLSRDNFQIGRLKLTTNASFFFKIRYQFLLFLYEEDIAVKKMDHQVLNRTLEWR